LGVDAYGSLYAVLSLVQIALLPAGMFTTVVAKFAAEFRALNDAAHIRALARTVSVVFGFTALAFLAAGITFAGAISNFLRVPAWAVILAAATTAAATLITTLRAIPQGTQDFRGFSVATMIEGAGKAGLGVILTARFGFGGALVGFFAGIVAGGVYVIWRLWKQYAHAQVVTLQVNRRRLLATTMGAAALFASTAILSYGDVLVVKHFFNAGDAGIYAAASLGGKILFFLVNFAPLVLIPKAVDRHSRGLSPLAALGGSLLMVVGLSGVGLLSFFVGAPLILHILVGTNFLAATSLLPWYGLAMALLAVTNVVASYSIALHRFAFSLPLISIALVEIVSISVYHPSLYSIVMVLAVGNALALVATSLALVWQDRYSKKIKP
jgi:O-antigen/teichoic acid export membrane protein